VVVLTCFVTCGYFDKCVRVLVIRVIVFTVSVLFLLCFHIVLLCIYILIGFSVLV
jgi:hypothetical protein